MSTQPTVCPQCNSSMPAALVRCRECGYRKQVSSPSSSAPISQPSSTADISSAGSGSTFSLDDMLDAAETVNEGSQAEATGRKGYSLDRQRTATRSRPAPQEASTDDLLDMLPEMQGDSEDSDVVAYQPSGKESQKQRTGHNASQSRKPSAERSDKVDTETTTQLESLTDSGGSSPGSSSQTPRRRRTRETGGVVQEQGRLEKVIRSVLKKPSTLSLPDESDKDVKSAHRDFMKVFKKLKKQIEAGEEDPSRKVVEELCEAFKTLGKFPEPEAVMLLAKHLTDSRDAIRECAAKMLGETRHPEAFEPLVRALIHANAEDRASIVVGLGQLGDRRAAEVLLALAEDDAQFNFRVTDSLAKLGLEIVPTLLETVEGDLMNSTLISIIVLGQLKDPRALEVLHLQSHSKSGTLRAHTAEALGRIGNTKSLPYLAKLLKDDKVGVRINAIGALSRFKDDRIAKLLSIGLSDSDLDVRKEAIRGLGHLGDKSAVKSLAPMLTNADPDLLLELADALGRLEDASATPQICELLRQQSVKENRPLRLKLIDALRRSKSEESVELLVTLLSDSDAGVRVRVIDAMAAIKDQSTAVEIEPYLKDDRDETVRASAARALGEIGDPESQPVLEQALADTSQVRIKAVIALGQLKDIASLPALTAMLRDNLPEIRYHSAMALANIGDAKSKRAIEALSLDDDPMVCRGAFKALQKLGDERSEKEILKAAKKSGTKKVSSATKSKSGGIAEVLESLVPYSWLPYLNPDDPQQRMIVWGGAGGGLVALVLMVFGIISMQAPERVIRRGWSMNVSISPDKSKIVVGRSYGAVEIWDVASKSLDQTIEVDLGSVNAVAFTESGNFWVAFENQLYRYENGTKITLPAAGSAYTGLLMNQDRSLVAAISREGGVWVYPSKATPETKPLVALNLGNFSGFALSPDGKKFATCSPATGLNVYSDAGEIIAALPTINDRSTFTAVEFDTTGENVTFGTSTQKVGVFNLETAAATAIIPVDSEGVPAPKLRAIKSMYTHPSQAETLYVVLIGQVYEVDLAKKAVTPIMRMGGSNNREISPDGTLVVTAGGDETKETFLYDLKSKSLAAEFVKL